MIFLAIFILTICFVLYYSTNSWKPIAYGYPSNENGRIQEWITIEGKKSGEYRISTDSFRNHPCGTMPQGILKVVRENVKDLNWSDAYLETVLIRYSKNYY